MAASPAIVLVARRVGADLWARLAGALEAALGGRARARVLAGVVPPRGRLTCAIDAALSGGAREVAGAAAAVVSVAIAPVARGHASVRRDALRAVAGIVARAGARAIAAVVCAAARKIWAARGAGRGLALAIDAALAVGAREVAGAAAAVIAAAVGRVARGLAVRRGTHPVFAHSVTRA